MNCSIAKCPAQPGTHCAHVDYNPTHQEVEQGHVHEDYICCYCGAKQCVDLVLQPVRFHGPFNPTKELVINSQTTWR
jgi:hypothetical protein